MTRPALALLLAAVLAGCGAPAVQAPPPVVIVAVAVAAPSSAETGAPSRVAARSQPQVTFASVQFPNVYLRMDGRGVTQPVGPGGGAVNGQFGAGPWEKFNLVRQPDGTYAIGSVEFPGVYLRMDGRGVTQPVGPGGGTVNSQFGVGPWEKFNLVRQPDGTHAIASVAFPGVYLRMDGTGVTQPVDSGGGTVNGQFGVGPWEKFRIVGLE